MTVDEVITSILHPNGVTIKKEGIVMEGKSKFKLDDAYTRRKQQAAKCEMQKNSLLKQIAQGNLSVKGLMNIGSTRHKQIKREPKDCFNDYVNQIN
jgi:hypothetical protein